MYISRRHISYPTVAQSILFILILGVNCPNSMYPTIGLSCILIHFHLLCTVMEHPGEQHVWWHRGSNTKHQDQGICVMWCCLDKTNNITGDRSRPFNPVYWCDSDRCIAAQRSKISRTVTQGSHTHITMQMHTHTLTPQGDMSKCRCSHSDEIRQGRSHDCLKVAGLADW